MRCDDAVETFKRHEDDEIGAASNSRQNQGTVDSTAEGQIFCWDDLVNQI